MGDGEEAEEGFDGEAGEDFGDDFFGEIGGFAADFGGSGLDLIGGDDWGLGLGI